ncbi:hypothetical protein CHS0354_027318 [Potamilus streckersoni]|uniref:Uncharacterized protein n=1 Tax=Potamilus streckersoni TaxID=2493646 RepID=A0AAE0VQL6_9BIVA|nr:hypothetical protein CHS0354_027318 [Potamilus streckersoni]
MSLAPNSALVIPNLTPVAPASQWNNPLPGYFYEIDEKRSFRLHNMNNRFLEMHETAVRSSAKPTKYGILTIITYMVNISKFHNISFSSQSNSGLGGVLKQRGKEVRNQVVNQVVIRGNFTGNFLCMNNESVLYPSKNLTDDCKFVEEFAEQNISNLFYREFNNSKWYVAINKDDTIRCGNVSRKNQKGSMFFKVEVNNSDPAQTVEIKHEDRPPCCARDRCDKRTKHRTEKNKHRHGKNKKNKCRTYKKWCRIKRQKFFSLKLKDLKKYYKRCLKEISKSQKTTCIS